MNVKVRLDRAVATSSWSSWFPEAQLQHLVTSRSDHLPIFLEVEQDVSKRHYRHTLRYEIMWEHESSLPKAISDAWKNGKLIRDLGDIVENLHGVMLSLKRWSKEKFGAVT
jgi:hypothetical protein